MDTVIFKSYPFIQQYNHVDFWIASTTCRRTYRQGYVGPPIPEVFKTFSQLVRLFISITRFLLYFTGKFPGY